MPIERLKPAHFFDEERLDALKALAPEAFADGKINWSTLKDALGGELEEAEEDAEHFGLNWPGKRDARRLAGKPSTGTLLPAMGEGIDEEKTRNIYIEGENLEVLKLLRKSYSGRVKMIYIDPPYNTGNDFVYDDDFAEPLNDYLKRTGQIDGEGKATTTNKKADGRFHSKWLSMMYPRLRLARELLRDDGVIFVSIDDNEVHHLRMLMNEVFGEENSIGTISVVSNLKGRSDDKYFASATNDLLVYKRDSFETNGVPLPDEYWDDYPEMDKDGRRFRLQGLRKRGSSARRIDRPKMFYPFYVENSTGNISLKKMNGWTEVNPYLSDGQEGRWRWGPDTVSDRLGELIARKVGPEGRWDIFQVDFAESDTGVKRIKPKTVWTGSEFSNESGNLEVKSLFGKKVFDTCKPTGLIRYCLEQAVADCDLILDFFAGSATTAHAVLDLNKEDGGKRQFILVQMPEATPADSEAAKAGYKTIAEIGKERIRRVIKKIKDEKAGELSGTGELDLGFKVYKLARSNFKPWENYHGESVEKIEELFAEYVTPLVPEWRKIENGLLTEILLLEGFPLDSVITPVSAYCENRVVEISSGFHEHRLIVCLDDTIEAATVKALALRENDSFVCLDSAIDTETKTRLADKGQIKTI